MHPDYISIYNSRHSPTPLFQNSLTITDKKWHPPAKNSVLALFLPLAVGISQVMCRQLHETSMRERHEQWMEKYGKEYKDATEKEKRFLIFKDNVEFIESFNSGNTLYKLDVNHLADLTIKEFKASLNGYKRPLEIRTRTTS
ncbi:hypothetical protein RJT34_30197 [Clitoria ternatea]|uniref:Cathepsin propeptide inhibitor domain-containing protein n=1 Tax=Clitoria ternatea TaxID=43366 RepID=A0AAN9ERX7_CLITE